MSLPSVDPTVPAHAADVVDPVAEMFAGRGTMAETSGARPLPLRDSGVVWRAEDGPVEVFAVELDEADEPAGPRRHLGTVAPGGLLFPFDLPRYGRGRDIIAVPGPDSRLRRLPGRLLRGRAVGDAVFATALAPWVDAWVAALAVGVTRDLRPEPQIDNRLAVPGPAALRQGEKTAAAEDTVVWIALGRRETQFLGREELFFRPGGEQAGAGPTLFPLTGDTWIEAREDTTTEVFATAEALRRPGIWTGLDAFHEAVCQGESVNRERTEAAGFERLQQRADYRAEARAATFEGIARVLDTGTDEDEAGKLDPAAMREPFFAACALVGQSRGIVMRQHPETLRNPGQADQLAAVAKASNCRARPVRLRGDWWRRDEEAMLGALIEGNVPVALLPRGPRAFDVVNPATNERRRIDAAVAETISPVAVCFYRPLPEGGLRARDLWRFGARGRSKDFLMIVGMAVFAGLLALLTPFLTGIVFDQVIPGAEHGALWQIAAALLAAAFGTAVFNLTKAIAVLRVESHMDYGLQAGIWDRLLTLPTEFYRRYSAGDLADRAAGIDAIRTTLSGVGTTALLGSVASLFQWALLFYYSTRLALVATVFVLVAVTIVVSLNLSQLRYQRRQLDLRGKITGLVLQLITGISKLRVAGAEDHALRAWAKEFSEQKRLSFLAGRITNFVEVFSAGAPVLCSLGLFFAYVYYQGDTAPGQPPALGATSIALTTGEFIGFYAAFGIFLEATLTLGRSSVELMSIFPTYERLRPIITTPAEIDESRSYPGQLAGEIEVSHLNFRHLPDGPLTLSDVSLRIRPGEFVAIVGPSGSGKSTLLRILLGFEKPESGAILYDSQDLANLDLREVRQQVGVVLQSSKLLPGDIFRNIVGASSLGLDDAWEAARLAGLDADIQGMPMGMHTVISEGGGTFSGGQTQRLMIARAVARRPRLLFFDEATSALDNRTQQLVSEGLERLKATRVVIAHRLSTIIHADRIYVLEAGQLVQGGTYEELMGQPGPFQELARRQLA